MEYVIRVSKAYSNSANRRNIHTKRGGYRIFGYDKEGKFASVRCNLTTYLYWKWLGHKAKLRKDAEGNKIVTY